MRHPAGLALMETDVKTHLRENGERKKSQDQNRLTFSASFWKDGLSCRKDAVRAIINSLVELECEITTCLHL